MWKAWFIAFCFPLLFVTRLKALPPCLYFSSVLLIHMCQRPAVWEPVLIHGAELSFRKLLPHRPRTVPYLLPPETSSPPSSLSPFLERLFLDASWSSPLLFFSAFISCFPSFDILCLLLDDFPGSSSRCKMRGSRRSSCLVTDPAHAQLAGPRCKSAHAQPSLWHRSWNFQLSGTLLLAPRFPAFQNSVAAIPHPFLLSCF